MTLLFDNQNVLDIKIDKPTAIMSKLTSQSDNQYRPFKPKIYKGKGEIKQALIIMMEVGIKAGIGQTVETGLLDDLIEIDLSMEKNQKLQERKFQRNI